MEIVEAGSSSSNSCLHILLKWVEAVPASQRRKGEGEGSSWCSGKLTWKSTDWCENGHGQAFYTQQVVAKPLKLFCWMIYTPCVSATFILFYMFQNMKYTKSRGLQGPNFFVSLSCSGFLSDLFAAKYWSYIPPRSQHCQRNNQRGHLEEASTNISICFKWTLNKGFEPNTKTNAEIIWILLNTNTQKTLKNNK